MNVGKTKLSFTGFSKPGQQIVPNGSKPGQKGPFLTSLALAEIAFFGTFARIQSTFRGA
jgi:hypothetical protein